LSERNVRPAFRWRVWQVVLWAMGIAAALAGVVVVAAAVASGGATDAVLWISLTFWTMLLGGAVGAAMGGLALILRALAGAASAALLRWLLGISAGLTTSAAVVWVTGASEPLLVLVCVMVGAGVGWLAQHITFVRRRDEAAAV
jgi:hypothetical protein